MSSVDKILIAVVIIVLAGAVLYMSNPDSENEVQDIITPQASVTPTSTVQATSNEAPNEVSIKLDNRRGFVFWNQPDAIGDVININKGDTVDFYNEGKVPVTLVTDDIPDFGKRLMDYDKHEEYIFDKSGSYTFYFEENKNLKITIVSS